MKDYIMVGDIKVLIDPEDYDKINQYNWHIQKERGILRCHKLRLVLHKFVLGLTDSDLTAYHINGNPWNNRKSNLQECSVGEAISHMRRFKQDLDAAYHANLYIWEPKISFM